MATKMSTLRISESGRSSLRVWISQAALKALGEPRRVSLYARPDSLYVTAEGERAPRVDAMDLGAFRVMRFGRTGGGAWITVPSTWARQVGVRKGSSVSTTFENRGTPTVRIAPADE